MATGTAPWASHYGQPYAGKAIGCACGFPRVTICQGTLMQSGRMVISVFTGLLAFATGFAWAAGEEGAQQPGQAQEQEQIYANPLMTEQERIEYLAKMRAAETAVEQEQIRKECRERMKERSQGSW